MNVEANEMWEKFIAQLNLENPLGGDEAKTYRVKQKSQKEAKEATPVHSGHKNFLGSIEKYKEIFLRANN